MGRNVGSSVVPVHLVWHRAELRTHDQPALEAAAGRVREGGIVVPLVIIDEAIFERADLTPRRQAHFLENVRALRESYRALGADLVVRRGAIDRELASFCAEFEAHRARIVSAHFVRGYTPYAKARDARAHELLVERGIEVCGHAGQYTHEPGEVRTKQGGRYNVFGAFARAWHQRDKPGVLPAPSELPSLPSWLRVGDIERVDAGIALPATGEAAALGRLEWFLDNFEADYETARDRPDAVDATSKLSLYFNIGVLSPRLASARARTQKWRSELIWWDFYADLLDRDGASSHREWKEDWRGFPWRDAQGQARHDFERWHEARTGFPLVDAGMRELRATGFMHNRVRMVTASFLTKHLLVDWRAGEAAFRALLLCGDRAQNVGNWQWVAGCGVDASPYFRVFNPVSQSQKFDPDGNYLRRWLPELQELPNRLIHEPWKANDKLDYPAPMIDLAQGRDRFLEVARAHLKRSKDS